MTEPIDMNAPLPFFGAEQRRAMCEWSDGNPCDEPMTLAHLVAVLAALTPEQLHAVLPMLKVAADKLKQEKARADRAEAIIRSAVDRYRDGLADRANAYDLAVHIVQDIEIYANELRSRDA